MENWAEEIILQIDTELANTREKDIRFFRIDEFKRNVKRVHEFSSNCPFCAQQRIYISEAANTINEAVEVPGDKRREYDRLISRLSKHMQKEHGFFPPYYYSYIYAFFGLIAGFLAGFILSQFFPEEQETMYGIGFTIFIVASYIIGGQRDSKNRTRNRLM